MVLPFLHKDMLKDYLVIGLNSFLVVLACINFNFLGPCCLGGSLLRLIPPPFRHPFLFFLINKFTLIPFGFALKKKMQKALSKIKAHHTVDIGNDSPTKS